MSDIVERLRDDTRSAAHCAMSEEAAEEIERLMTGLTAAIRAAELALFVIRKQGVMPNSSWESGFNKDLAAAKAALPAPPHGR